MAIAKLSIDLETRLATFERDLNRMSSLADGAARRMQGAFKGVTVMFAGLAGALSVGAIKSAFDSYVQGAAAMDDLAEIVGSTTEKVSALANVAKVSGTDLGLLEGGMVKLAKAVTTVQDETGSLGSAFAALNLDPKEMKLLDTSDQLKVLAERLNEYEDGASKTAIATALLGKSGAQLLPYLKDLATTGDLVSKVTSEQAAAAEEYEKNLKRLAIVNSEVARIFSAEVVPAANALVKTFIDVMNGSDGVRGSVKGLAEDGSVRNWAVDSVRAIGFVIDAFDGVARAAQIVGKTIGGAAAQASALASGDLKGYKAIGAEWRADIENVVQAPLFSQQLEKNISAMKALGTAAVDTKKKLNFSAAIPSAKGGRGKGGGTADRAASFQDYDQQLVQKIASAIEKTDVVKAAELVRELEKLDQLAATGLDPAIVKAVRDDLTGATKEAADETARLNSLLSATPTDKLQASRDDMLLLTKALTDGRIAEEQYMEAVTARLDGMSEKTKEAVGEMDEFTKAAAKNIENTLADFLYDPFSEGMDSMGRKFADVIRKMAADALAANLAKSLFGDLGAKGGGDGGWVGSAFNAVVSALGFHQGGVVGSGGQSFTRAVPASMFAGARRYHGGGLAGDEVPAILQKGERVLTKDQQRESRQPAPSQNIRIVNAFDQSVIGDYLGSSAGEKIIMNAVQRNAGAFRAAMA